MDFARSARALADRYDREAAGEDVDEDIGSGSEDDGEMIARMDLFMPVVQRLVGALGGFEVSTSPHSSFENSDEVDGYVGLQDVENPETKEIETVYRPGDSALGVMRDLKKLWRKDDTDDERTVFRCFAKSGLCSELIALLEECTGRGLSGRKIALAAADLLAALTWPIDVQQELKDMMDDTEAVVTDYASLLRSQVEFKVCLVSIDTSDVKLIPQSI